MEQRLCLLDFVLGQIGDVVAPEKPQLDPLEAEIFSPHQGLLEIHGHFVGDDAELKLIQFRCRSARGTKKHSRRSTTCQEFSALHAHPPVFYVNLSRRKRIAQATGIVLQASPLTKL